MDDDSGEFGEQGRSSAPAVCCWSLFGPRTCGWDLLFLVGGGDSLRELSSSPSLCLTDFALWLHPSLCLFSLGNYECYLVRG